MACNVTRTHNLFTLLQYTYELWFPKKYRYFITFSTQVCFNSSLDITESGSNVFMHDRSCWNTKVMVRNVFRIHKARLNWFVKLLFLESFPDPFERVERDKNKRKKRQTFAWKYNNLRKKILFFKNYSQFPISWMYKRIQKTTNQLSSA